VFTGSHAEGLEFGLVLDAKGIAYERVSAGGAWLLLVPPAAAAGARMEIERYAVERTPRRTSPSPLPHAGSAAGAAVYAAVLILVAYCAGIQLFDVDWFDAGALESRAGAPVEWFRALTALTLHLDQEHLLGNLLFGIGIGVLAGRVFGPGVAWLSIVLAGGAGNAIELAVSPPWHRAVGASTALFAALGLLSGFGWGRRPQADDRRLYRWAPLFGGVCLLALLGAGNEHVDVLGHVLGFLSGTVLGWLYAQLALPRRQGAAFRSGAIQLAMGAAAIVALGAAWAAALRH
jgi:membrane associated rhomboid family serine protease